MCPWRAARRHREARYTSPCVTGYGVWPSAVRGILGLRRGRTGSGSTPPPTGQTSSYGFEPYLQQVVQQSSCNNNTPVSTTNVNFHFAADQDTAEPRDLSRVMPGCK